MRTANNLVFLDTNILVYLFDHTVPAKQKCAEELLEHYIVDKRAVISSQVVQEFINVSINQFKIRLSVEEREMLMTEMLVPLCAHTPAIDFYERAIKLCISNTVNFYDALIIQAAIDLGCKTLYSENLHNGQQFGSVKICNPFI